MKTLPQRLRQLQSAAASGVPVIRLPGRVLYALSHSFPFSSNGYAVRSHGVAAGLVRAGCDVVAASRPGVPWDKAEFKDRDVALSHVIDEVRYVHSRAPCRSGMALEDYLAQSVPVLSDLMRVFKPSAVMAASNWHNALPAAIAARELGLPFFYEVRGFWEVSRAARDPGWEHTPGFAHEVAGETAVAMAADRVFTLNRFMRDEMVRRGVAAERIALVPNGFPGWVDDSAMAVSRADLGIRSRFVVGYIGSFNVYEGLEELIEALAMVRGRGVDAALLLVGSGEPRGFLVDRCEKTVAYRALAEKLGVGEFVFLPGRVPQEQTEAYYALLDVVVIPRRPFAVSELVSPMKPLEAAAHGKQVLMSDVAPLLDLAGLCSNFSYFAKGDVTSLAAKLLELLRSPIANMARDEALSQFTWAKNVAPIVDATRKFGPKSLR